MTPLWLCAAPTLTKGSGFPGSLFGQVAVSRCFHGSRTVPVWSPISLFLILCAHLIEVGEKKKRFEACPICPDIKRCLAQWNAVEASRGPDGRFNSVSGGLLTPRPLALPRPGSWRALERGDSPSGFDTQHLVRSADKDTVCGLALVFWRRCSGLLRAWRKHFWGIEAYTEGKKMPYFLNTWIGLKFFLNFQKTFWIQHQKVAVLLKFLICQTSKIRNVTHWTTSSLGWVWSPCHFLLFLFFFLNGDDQRPYGFSFIPAEHQTLIQFW